MGNNSLDGVPQEADPAWKASLFLGHKILIELVTISTLLSYFECVCRHLVTQTDAAHRGTAAAGLGARALPLCLQRHKRVICSVCSWSRDGARQVSLLACRAVDLIVALC